MVHDERDRAVPPLNSTAMPDPIPGTWSPGDCADELERRAALAGGGGASTEMEHTTEVKRLRAKARAAHKQAERVEQQARVEQANQKWAQMRSSVHMAAALKAEAQAAQQQAVEVERQALVV